MMPLSLDTQTMLRLVLLLALLAAAAASPNKECSRDEEPSGSGSGSGSGDEPGEAGPSRPPPRRPVGRPKKPFELLSPDSSLSSLSSPSAQG